MCGPATARHLPSSLEIYPAPHLFRIKTKVKPKKHSELPYPDYNDPGDTNSTTKTRPVSRLALYLTSRTQSHPDWDWVRNRGSLPCTFIVHSLSFSCRMHGSIAEIIWWHRCSDAKELRVRMLLGLPSG
jgi:hypothetical protein